MNRPTPLPTRLLLAVAVPALAVMVLGCSNTKKTANVATPPKSTAASVTTGASVTATPAPTAAPSAGGLSGTWSGHYTGSFTGTFSLTWQQAASNLSGTIMISAFNNQPTSINGTVQGGSIRFGTVGSTAISYTGSVSGNSMSGTWQVQAGGRSAGNGSWSASKSS